MKKFMDLELVRDWSKLRDFEKTALWHDANLGTGRRKEVFVVKWAANPWKSGRSMHCQRAPEVARLLAGWGGWARATSLTCGYPYVNVLM